MGSVPFRLVLLAVLVLLSLPFLCLRDEQQQQQQQGEEEEEDEGEEEMGSRI